MTGCPPDRCGYEWPSDCERANEWADGAPSRSSCVRPSLEGDADRCVWHAGPEAIDRKTGRVLAESCVSPEVRGQTGPFAELLDGAVLSECELNDVPLARTALRGGDLKSASLADADLTGATLAGADLENATLRGANLRNDAMVGANFRGADLTGATLYKAEMAEAYLGRADLSGTNLENADLSGANLGRAVLNEASLGRADLTRVTLQGGDLTDATLGRADLSRATLFKADLSGAYLGRADLTDAILQECTLSGTNLGRATLRGANFGRADLTGANLGRADLTGANLGRAVLAGANLRDADLTGADLGDADLTGANLVDAELTDATMRGALLGGATLYKADLVGVTLADADLTDTELRNADLTDADLRDADLSGSDLRESELGNVTVNQGTRCGVQTRGEAAAVEPEEWDAVARAYNDLKNAFSEAGLVGKARQHHVLERRARGFEARANGSVTGYVDLGDGGRRPSLSRDGGNIGAYLVYAESWVSRVTTGYGVRPLRLAVWMLVLFGLGAVLYEVDPGISDSVYYSVVTFTTAPPSGSEPTIPAVRAVELIETFGGTLLIVLLGYVLGNRERF